ncbi:MAG: hypothetical protein A3H42_04145 [Deltaproteobacteria bacterium RIFCSPLOWO2_02_FULL_46_8]|nr:MAG: hypothetical protein A3H42_04145 [Deltaproteobacteria bacterium RIFCSPLOWO2_02_FULL_46_8]
MNKFKKIIPWIIAIGIFAYLFYIYPPRKIWSALHYVNLATFIPFAIVYFFFIYWIDIVTMSKMLGRFGFVVPVKELIPARGATYLLMVLNYAAGQAGFAYYLKRTHKIPLWEAFSIFFFIAVIDLYWIITLAGVGSFFQEYQIAGVPLKKFVWAVVLSAYFLFFLNFFFWRGPLYKKLEEKNGRFFQWIRKKDIFRIFKEARFMDYIRLAVLRIPIHISLIVSMVVVLKTFGVLVPFVKILGNIPLVILIGALPITPGGLGTTNAALVELLNPYLKGPLFDNGTITPSELLFAASLLWMFANYFLKTVIGAFCLRHVSKSLFAIDQEPKGIAVQVGEIQPL